MPSIGGEAVQVTRNSGDIPQESQDGKYLYYMKGWPDAVREPQWMEIKKRKCSILCTAKANGLWLRKGFTSSDLPTKWDTVTSASTNSLAGQIRKVLTIQRPVNAHIAVSPDGRTILYPQSDASGSVLILGSFGLTTLTSGSIVRGLRTVCCLAAPTL
jgi:hypothetical protein